MSLAIALHVLAAVIWVGGMFFAHQVLRPVAVDRLEPPHRLPVWVGVFRRFFPWVWAAVILLPVTGYWIIFAMLGGMGHAGLHIHIMNGVGLVMIVLFVYLFFGPYPRLRRAVAGKDWPEGARHLASIRRIVGINLILGLITIAVASGGRYF